MQPLSVITVRDMFFKQMFRQPEEPKGGEQLRKNDAFDKLMKYRETFGRLTEEYVRHYAGIISEEEFLDEFGKEELRAGLAEQLLTAKEAAAQAIVQKERAIQKNEKVVDFEAGLPDELTGQNGQEGNITKEAA